MTRFLIDNPRNDRVIAEVRALADSFYHDRVAIEPSTPVLGLDLGGGSALASAVIAAIALCLQLEERRERRRTATMWSHEKLVSAVNAEMIGLGVTSARLLKVENFDALLTGTKRPCRVKATDDETGELITLYVFYDGTIYRIVEGSVSVRKDERWRMR